MLNTPTSQEKLGDTAGQVVKEAIEGRLGLTAGFDALYRTTDTDAIDSFGEAKVVGRKATELLTDVRSFHLAIVDGDVAQASSKLDDILDAFYRSSPSWTNWRFHRSIR